MTTRDTYTVVYRVGGYARFQWRQTQGGMTQQQALEMHRSVLAQGYHAFATKDANMRHGLPTTWHADDDPSDVTVLPSGWLSQVSTKDPDLNHGQARRLPTSHT